MFLMKNTQNGVKVMPFSNAPKKKKKIHIVNLNVDDKIGSGLCPLVNNLMNLINIVFLN